MLTDEEVKHIARLARLELTGQEIEKFGKQLSDIIDHAKMLDKVDTENIKPIAQITGLENITHEDEKTDCAYTKELLEQSPQSIHNNMIKVRNVF